MPYAARAVKGKTHEAELSDHVLTGGPPIPLILRRSSRAKRISLRISSADGRVTLTLPSRLAEHEALAFARSKEDWIRRHLSARGDDVRVEPGAMVPVGGRLLRVTQGQGRRVVFDGDTALVPGPEGRIAARFQAHLKELARDRLAGACDDYAAALGRPFTRITLRDTRSRWGSCTSDGGLMFSWRLIMMPGDVLDYVAAHEVAHLAQMNHSPAFWAEVTRIYGDYAKPRGWLRKNGGDVHRYRF